MREVEDLVQWMDQTSEAGWRWYAKILSGNDTLANEAHQAGPYIPKHVVFELFPSINRTDALNPRIALPVRIDSHSKEVVVTVIYYNNKVVEGGTRNEARITGWGGRDSPLLDPDATGAICVFAFKVQPGTDAEECRIWLCASSEEQEAVESRVGPVEPGQAAYGAPNYSIEVLAPPISSDIPCTLQLSDMPPEWLIRFPEAHDLVNRSAEHLRTVRRAPPDERLVKRRLCEFELFRSIEDALVLPRAREGFATVDLFVSFANAVTNRRKSRSGASLELQAKKILIEEGLRHSHNEVSEDNKRPDFLFPSADAYRDNDFPHERLIMLAAKTTCKDRWRQILNEADRIPRKHLLTLQHGVSRNQFDEMSAAGVTLVVPSSLHECFHKDIRPRLLSLGTFIETTRARTQ